MYESEESLNPALKLRLHCTLTNWNSNKNLKLKKKKNFYEKNKQLGLWMHFIRLIHGQVAHTCIVTAEINVVIKRIVP